jgi:dolichyl-phosphate-mannose--protein O-mannosyl transferase
MMPEITPDKTPDTTPEAIPAAVTEVTAEVPPEVVPEITAQAIPEIVPAAPPKSRWQRLLHWEFSGLAVIILITLIFHFFSIVRPPTIVWDEVWYVGDSRSILSGTGDLRPEHPPLAKLYIVAGSVIFNGFKAPTHDTGARLTAMVGSDEANDKVISVTDVSVFNVGDAIRIGQEQMTVNSIDYTANQLTVKRNDGGSGTWSHSANDSIFVFTDNAFGWRFFSIIFGTIGIILVYLICRKLKLSWKISMLATFLFAFENMTFIHSGLALLDVYMVTFMLAAILMYLDEKYVLMGLFVALSAECKLVGVLILIAIFIHWALYRKDKWKEMAAGLIVAAVSFVVLIAFFDFFITGKIENPITRITSLLSSTSANQFTIPKLSISSRPWTWLYPQFVALKDDYNVPFIVYSYDPQYISFISSTIQIMIIPTICYMVYKTIKKNQAAAFLVLWFIATYLIWIPLDIATNRVTFVFYFLCVTPAICIGLAIAITDWLNHLKARELLLNRTTPLQRTGYVAIYAYLMIHFAIFIVFNPAIPVIIKTWLPPFA